MIKFFGFVVKWYPACEEKYIQYSHPNRPLNWNWPDFIGYGPDFEADVF